jgi:predicted HAD superfamily Cof-like phosphohydrolase
MIIDEAIEMVRTFHRQIQAPIADVPRLLPGHPGKALAAAVLVGRLANELVRESDGEKDLVLCRAAMTLEELAEWLRAHAQQDLTAAADAIGDRLYLLLGDGVASGLPFHGSRSSFEIARYRKISHSAWTKKRGEGHAVGWPIRRSVG